MSDSEIFGIGLIIILVIVCICALFAIVAYVMSSIGLYTIAKNRGYDKAFLAWIPIANLYLIGAIADNINACYNKTTKNRIVLIVFYIITNIFSTIASMMSSFSEEWMYIDDFENYIASVIGTVVLPYIILMIISLVFAIIRFSVLYKIYQDLSASSGVLWLILTILFQLDWLALFVLRNKPSSSVEYFNENIRKQQEYQQNADVYQQPQIM